MRNREAKIIGLKEMLFDSCKLRLQPQLIKAGTVLSQVSAERTVMCILAHDASKGRAMEQFSWCLDLPSEENCCNTAPAQGQGALAM